MRINVRMKTLGKRQSILGEVPIEISDTVKTMREFLTELVETEVERYNQKGIGTQSVPFLSKEEPEEQAAVGKVVTDLDGEKR